MTAYNMFVVFFTIMAIISFIAGVFFIKEKDYLYSFVFIGLAVMFIAALVL